MALRPLSRLGFAMMAAGVAWLVVQRAILARHPGLLGIQGFAFALMLAARLAFGRRSFHASAAPTAGALVTRGPYRLLRHPIYAAVLYFVWATAVDHRSLATAAAAVLVTAGGAIRMYAEETLLSATYPEYGAYRARTARIIPFVL